MPKLDRRELPGSAWPIGWLLFAIVMAAILPLGAYISNILVQQASDADEEARALALSTASAAAAWTREKLRSAETLARALAERPEIHTLDKPACNALLGSLLPLFRDYGNISVVDREYRFICSAVEPLDPEQRVPMHGGLAAAFEGRFGVSEPLIGVLPAQITVSAAYPVRDTSNAITGAVTIPFALAVLQPIDDPAALPRGTRVRIIDRNGALLASSARDDPELGRNLRGTKNVDLALLNSRGTSRARGPDGAEHIVAYAPVGLSDWSALAELPAAELLAKNQTRTALSALLGVLALILALLAASVITRYIARSLRSLEAAVAANAGGRVTHAAPRGPAEIRKLAQAFNSMVDERMRAEYALRENEARLRLAVGAAGIGAWDWDIRNAGIYLSPEWKRQLGFEDDEFPSDQDAWRARLHPDEQADVMAGLVQFLKSDATSYECEYRLRAKDDTYRYIYSRADAVRDRATGAAVRMIGAHIDVTRRRTMENALKDTLEQMQGLSMRIVEVEDNERRHISRELHDRIGGNIAALQISLSMLADNIARGDAPAAAALLEDARDVVSATSSEVRTLMTELRPAALDDFGLAAPLRTYATALAARVGINLTFSAPDSLPRAKPAVETAFFRIAQEALTNIAKHAQAQNVHIELSESAGVLCMCVQDDGIGFDKLLRHPGQGLRNMRERADAVGATLKVESSERETTRIIVEVRL